MSGTAEKVYLSLRQAGYDATLINARFVKPLDTERIDELAADHYLLITIEENILTGGFGEQVTSYVMQKNLPMKVQNFGIADEYVEHGNVEVLRKEVGLNPETIVEKTVEVYEKILLTRE